LSSFNFERYAVASILALWFAGASVFAAPSQAVDPTKDSAKKPLVAARKETGSSGAARGKGWMLVQNDKVSGDRAVYLSSKGIRIENKQSHTVIVATPPTWRVATVSDSKRVFYECPVERFDNPLSRPIAVVYGVNLSLIPLKKKSVVTRFGVTATLYESPTRLKSKEFWNTPLEEKGSHRLPSSAIAEFTEALHLPEPETMVMLRTYGLPKVAGIPLSFQYSDQDNDVHKFLRTFSMQPVDVADDMFKVPAGYKHVVNPEQVTRASENDGIENLF
jgi:hypothetical protein